MFTLTGRAPDVPYASVDSGHSRTTRVGARSLQAVGSLHMERSEGASQARGAPEASDGEVEDVPAAGIVLAMH